MRCRACGWPQVSRTSRALQGRDTSVPWSQAPRCPRLPVPREPCPRPCRCARARGTGKPGGPAPAQCGPRSDRFEPGGSCHRHRVCPRTDATLAWIPLPARRDLRRDRNELRRLLGGGRAPSSSACSSPTARRRASRSPSGRRRSGTATRRRSGPGSATGSACTGPTSPSAGLRCHPSKLLLDPYATAVEGEVDWNEAMFTYRFDDPDGPVNDLDSGPYMPKGVVTSPYFDWAHDRPPRTPWNETVVYEVHVKGFTQRHPGHPRGAARHLRGARAPGGARVPHRRSASRPWSCCRSTSSSRTPT